MTIRILPLALLALGAVARADRTLVYRFEIAGTPAGESRVTLKDDGTFAGRTDANLGQKVLLDFSGTVEGPLVPKWRMTITSAGKPVEVRADGATVTVENAGKTAPLPNAALPAKLSAIAPFFCRTLLPALPESVAADRPAPPIPALLLDNFARTEVEVLARGVRRVAGKSVRTARIRSVGLKPEIELAWDEAGECVGFSVPVQSFTIVAEGYEGVFASPLDAYPELSPAKYEIARLTVQVPMRDGVNLAAELLRPKGEGKFPTILVRTPYGRAPQTLGYGYLVRRGYAVLVQDCRGRGDSGGAWDPFVNETADADDTLKWIAAQDWSDGGAGMIGGSYGGYVQWAAAAAKNPVLKCIVPQVSPPGSAMTNLPYLYGVPMLFAGLWWLRIVEGKNADMTAASRGFPNPAGLKSLPLTAADDDGFAHDVPLWDEWMRRDRASAWKGWDFQREIGATTIPALHVSGYWDGDEIGTMLNWESRAHAGHDAQWLVYGPWPHGFNASTTFGGVDFGKDSVLELDSVYLRFFDTYLKGRSVGWEETPRVKAFVTGANRWTQGTAWPLPQSREATLALASGGRLLDALPKGDRPDVWTYDPARAEIPKELTAKTLDLDGSLTVKREELAGGLLFRTAPQKGSLTVAGPFTLEASLSTSANDTDLFASLYDEAPDGSVRSLGQAGALRASYARFPQASGPPEPLKPGRVYRLSVRLWDFVHELKPGHRLVLRVSSDGFPIYARNLGFAEPPATAKRMQRQRNTLYHDPARPSLLRFRVLAN